MKTKDNAIQDRYASAEAAVIVRLRAAIAQSGRSMGDVASSASMAERDLQDALAGRRRMTVTEVVLFSIAMGIEASSLFRRPPSLTDGQCAEIREVAVALAGIAENLHADEAMVRR
ncbi:hypothetical protein [Nocardia wallacei]|uniref:hypothetical protein n=1 Tax=Nocardia wallacei TaxID=480035 RepID=UPI00245503C8|nr:hypothetical protein [Nocardia wallacei]